MSFKNSRALLALGVVGALAVSACGASTSTPGSSTSGGSKSLNVLMVGNPQMKDIETLAQKNFVDKTGIKVNFTILPENELRDKVAQDVATKAGQYDVVTIGAYEGSVWTANDWLTNLQERADKDTAFDSKDLLPAMTGVLSKDGDMYAVPFYGESAMTMYRKDLFDKYGLTMPANPTWDEIADLASKIDKKEAGVSGICLRGLPGWGENMAVFGSILNAYGGGFFDDKWNAIYNSPDSMKAAEMYVNLITKYGETGAAQSGFTECLNNFAQGKSAMWFDATSAANSVESPSMSKVAGKVGYADAPKDKARSGWVWAWAWAVPKTTKDADTAWKFISWASSKEYEKTAGSELGWTRVPDGKRKSTYDIPEYAKATAAYTKVAQYAIENSDPTNCSVIKRPAPGCQYLAIPEFADLGTKIGQEMSAAIAGQKSVKDAVDASQKLAEAVAAKKK